MSEFFNLDRRALLERALLLAGGVAASGFSGTALAKAAAGGRRYLDAPAYALLNAVADTIVPRTDTPGAVDAGVPAKVDALLANWASGQRRYELSHALTAIDAAATKAEGMSFGALSPERRKAFLVPYDEAALKPAPRAQSGGLAAMMSGPATVDPGYTKLKELVVVLFYLSETALTHDLPYIHAPGEWQPSVPVTPETRPFGGAAFI